MTALDLVALASEALALALWVSAPALAASLGAGVLVGTLAATTRIDDPSVRFPPRALAVALSLLLAGGWMAAQVVTFTDQLWRALPALVP
ncbi:MAG: flagellar biosynthetic protein FliQ [Sandaracinaceae bacterium]